jgi:hypothetical protein
MLGSIPGRSVFGEGWWKILACLKSSSSMTPDSLVVASEEPLAIPFFALEALNGRETVPGYRFEGSDVVIWDFAMPGWIVHEHCKLSV